MRSLPAWLGFTIHTPCLSTETTLNSCRSGTQMPRFAGGVEKAWRVGTGRVPKIEICHHPQIIAKPSPSKLFCFLKKKRRKVSPEGEGRGQT